MCRNNCPANSVHYASSEDDAVSPCGTLVRGNNPRFFATFLIDDDAVVQITSIAVVIDCENSLGTLGNNNNYPFMDIFGDLVTNNCKPMRIHMATTEKGSPRVAFHHVVGHLTPDPKIPKMVSYLLTFLLPLHSLGTPVPPLSNQRTR